MTNYTQCVRKGSIEVFRCLLMLLIVFYHAWYYGLFGYEHGMYSHHSLWTLVFSALIIWHVDGFVAISGWFGIKFSWRKFLSLYALILFYSILGTVLRYFMTEQLAFNVSGGWFGGGYLMLMLCAPFLNAAIESLSQNCGQLVLAWGLLALGVTLTWLPKHFFSAVAPRGVCSCSFFTLLFVYCTARACRYILAEKIISLPKLIAVVGLLPGGMLLMGGGVAMWKFVRGSETFVWSVFATKIDYLSPFIWPVAIAIFLVFLWHLHFPIWMESLCRWVSPSLFAIYLIHDVLFYGRNLYLVPQREFYAIGLHPFICIVASGFVAFCAGAIVDAVRRLMKHGIIWIYLSLRAGRK